MVRLLGLLFGYGVRVGVCNVLVFIFLTNGAVAQTEKTVIAFGDSLTQGFGLPADLGFVPQMEHWLNAQGASVRMINAGVSGETTAGGAARIAWTLAEPADVIIVALGGNDVLRGLDPAEARTNLRQILETATLHVDQIVLVGIQAPGNYGASYKMEFDAIYPDLAAEFGARLYPNFINAIQTKGDRALDFLQADRLHPNAQGVDLIVQDMGPVVLQALSD